MQVILNLLQEILQLCNYPTPSSELITHVHSPSGVNQVNLSNPTAPLGLHGSAYPSQSLNQQPESISSFSSGGNLLSLCQSSSSASNLLLLWQSGGNLSSLCQSSSSGGNLTSLCQSSPSGDNLSSLCQSSPSGDNLSSLCQSSPSGGNLSSLCQSSSSGGNLTSLCQSPPSRGYPSSLCQSSSSRDNLLLYQSNSVASQSTAGTSVPPQSTNVCRHCLSQLTTSSSQLRRRKSQNPSSTSSKIPLLSSYLY